MGPLRVRHSSGRRRSACEHLKRILFQRFKQLLLIQPRTNAKGSLNRRDNSSSNDAEDADNSQFYWWYDKSGDKGSNWTLRTFRCLNVIVHTILGGIPVILWISLGGKPKWLPLTFGYHDGVRTSPIGNEAVTNFHETSRLFMTSDLRRFDQHRLSLDQSQHSFQVEQTDLNMMHPLHSK